MSLGLDVIGADYGAILSTVFQAAGGVVDYASQAQKDKDAAQGMDSALSAVIAADQAATSAVAKANTSAMLAKADPSQATAAKADASAAANAVAVQNTAGAALPEEKRGDRVKAAQEAVDSATKKVSASSGAMKTVALAWLHAAQRTLSKAKGESDKKDQSDQGEAGGFFAKKLVGPFRVGHAVVVGVAGGIIGVLFAVLKKSHKK